MLDEVTKNEIFSIIETAMEDENLWKYKMDLREQNHVIYGGHDLLISANIFALDHNSHRRCMHLYIKISEKSKSKNTLNKKVYRREKYVFVKIISAIFNFLKTNISIWYRPCDMDFIPVPYKMFSTETREVLMFNSIIHLGYKPHTDELFATPSMKYCILKHMANLHAISFAFRVHKREEFEEIMREWQEETSTKEMFLQLPNIEQKVQVGLELTMDILVEENRLDLIELLQKDIQEGAMTVITNILSDVPDDNVIIHGDCWMHNVVSKTVENGTETSTKIKLIAWQLAALHSPVLDLAYFLYFTYTEETNEKFEDYVEYYYNEFCDCMLKCDSDPQQLFPFTRLLEHFLKYSPYCLILALVGIPFIMINSCLNNNICIRENRNHFEDPEMKENCEYCNCNYESMKYVNLKEELRNSIKEKILGILELHYKYFRV
ncbi:unnamed protein product [Psylliodes chrysocephalus]|uniref:CHK kinase-like domain-containing protein n=1 Tax=Psylliodes chrysocephalus TaxID=3402493 RepID=A0A9P0G8S3_9CUCU|nr:unnamed protein product [Psylliodes chrysocephala]